MRSFDARPRIVRQSFVAQLEITRLLGLRRRFLQLLLVLGVPLSLVIGWPALLRSTPARLLLVAWVLLLVLALEAMIGVACARRRLQRRAAHGPTRHPR